MIALIKEELSAIDCFSVMMDESSDLSHKEQVSVVIRYVDKCYIIQLTLNLLVTQILKLFQILLKKPF